jgi:hypothetical protein
MSESQKNAFLDAVAKLDQREVIILRGALIEISSATRDPDVSDMAEDALALSHPKGGMTDPERIAVLREALKVIRDESAEEWPHERAKQAVEWAEGRKQSPYLEQPDDDVPEHWFY